MRPDEIDELQDRVIQSPSEWTLQRLFVLKRELLTIRRATSPAREVLNQLTNRELDVIRPEHLVYFRDVYDHLIRVTDELDNYRDLVSGTVEIYLSTINNNLSTIMKRLTGVTVILAGIGAVAGIFGMSEAGKAITGTEATNRKAGTRTRFLRFRGWMLGFIAHPSYKLQSPRTRFLPRGRASYSIESCRTRWSETPPGAPPPGPGIIA